MKELAFSVIGFGRIGQRHAKIIHEFKGTKLLSVTDVNPDEFKNLDALGLGVNSFTSIDEFLSKDDGRSDVVNITTPNGYHTDYAIRCLNAGYHVVIEKPMGLSIKECEAVVQAELSSGKQVFVVAESSC